MSTRACRHTGGRAPSLRRVRSTMTSIPLQSAIVRQLRTGHHLPHAPSAACGTTNHSEVGHANERTDASRHPRPLPRTRKPLRPLPGLPARYADSNADASRPRRRIEAASPHSARTGALAALHDLHTPHGRSRSPRRPGANERCHARDVAARQPPPPPTSASRALTLVRMASRPTRTAVFVLAVPRYQQQPRRPRAASFTSSWGQHASDEPRAVSTWAFLGRRSRKGRTPSIPLLDIRVACARPPDRRAIGPHDCQRMNTYASNQAAGGAGDRLEQADVQLRLGQNITFDPSQPRTCRLAPVDDRNPRGTPAVDGCPS